MSALSCWLLALLAILAVIAVMTRRNDGILPAARHVLYALFLLVSFFMLWSFASRAAYEQSKPVLYYRSVDVYGSGTLQFGIPAQYGRMIVTRADALDDTLPLRLTVDASRRHLSLRQVDSADRRAILLDAEGHADTLMRDRDYAIPDGGTFKWSGHRGSSDARFTWTDSTLRISFPMPYAVTLYRAPQGADPDRRSGVNRFLLSNRYEPGLEDLVILEGVAPGFPFRADLTVNHNNSNDAGFRYETGGFRAMLNYNGEFELFELSAAAGQPRMVFRAMVAASTANHAAHFYWLLLLTVISAAFLLVQTHYSTRLLDNAAATALFGLVWIILCLRLVLSLKVAVQGPKDAEAAQFAVALLALAPLVVHISLSDWLPAWRRKLKVPADRPIIFHAVYVLALVCLVMPFSKGAVLFSFLGIAFAALFSLMRDSQGLGGRLNLWLTANVGGSGSKTWAPWQSAWWPFLLLIFVLGLHVVNGLTRGHSETLWGLRDGPFSQFLFLLVFFRFAQWLWFRLDSTSSRLAPLVGTIRLKLGYYLLTGLGVFVWAVVTMGVTNDNGAFVYAAPSLLVAILVDLMYSAKQGYRRLGGAGGAAIFPAVLLIVGFILLLFLRQSLAQYIRNHPDRPAAQWLVEQKGYRMLSLRDAALIPTKGASEDYESLVVVDYYASAGSGGGLGFLHAELAPAVQDEAQNDQLFAVLLLSEHGFMAGFILFAVFLLIAVLALYLYVVERSAADNRGDYSIERVALGAIALFTLCFVAIWMMCCNLGSLFYVGKSITLLGLNSGMDVTYGLLLIALIFSLLRSWNPDTDLDRARHDPGALPVGASALVLILLLAPFFLLPLASHAWAGETKIRSAEGYASLVDSLFRRTTPPLLKAVRPQGKDSIIYDDGSVKAAGLSGNRRPAEQGLWASITNSFRKREGLAGLVAQTRLKDDMQRFNSDPGKYPYFRLRFEEVGDSDVWIRPGYYDRENAKIHNPVQPTFRYGGHVMFREEAPAPVVRGFGVAWQPTFQPDSLGPVSERRKTALNKDLKLFSQGCSVILEFSAATRTGTVKPVYLNSSQINDGESTEIRLEDRDIVTYTDDNGASRTVQLDYSGAGGLYTHRWINGRVTTWYNSGDAFHLAQPLYNALTYQGRIQRERGLSTTKLDTLDFEVSIRKGLQTYLQKRLNDICHATPKQVRVRKGDFYDVTDMSQIQRNLLPASILVMDCMNGEILAMATYPTVDPNQPKPHLVPGWDWYNHKMSDRTMFNQNFVPHVMGSAGKPILSTISLTKQPELAGLTIAPHGPVCDTLFSIPLQPELDCPMHGQNEDIGFIHYLAWSDNLYNAMLHSLALRDGLGYLDTAGLVSKQAYYVRPLETKMHRRIPDWGDLLSGRGHFMVHPYNKEWAAQLWDIFDIPYEHSAPADWFVYDDALWQPLAGVFEPRTVYNQNALMPEEQNQLLNQFNEFRQDWISFLLGGKLRLNNVQIATAYARILRGEAVEPRIVHDAGSETPNTIDWPPLGDDPRRPEKRGDFERARRLVMDGCKAVITTGTGHRAQWDTLNAHGFERPGRFYFGKTGTARRRHPTEVSRNKDEIRFWANQDGYLPNSTMWIGVYGEGSRERPQHAYCVVIYAEDRGEEYALQQIGVSVLPEILRKFGW